MAQLDISMAVGNGPLPFGPASPNQFDDVLLVQYLLNRAPGVGRPVPPLDENGICDLTTMASIMKYESSIGQVPDGRIDPGDSTMTALNAIALSEFEGITDPSERSSIIQRPLREWNFTRGDFKTLTEFASQQLTFDPLSIWLPAALKSRLLTIFNMLLKPTHTPSATWGVSSFDWYHCHLGLWSGTFNVPLSPASQSWLSSAKLMSTSISNLVDSHIVAGAIPAASVPAFQIAYAARLAMPDVASLLNTYATLPQAVMIHHTYEEQSRRPTMGSDDVRRHWMVHANSQVATSPYRTPEAQNSAQSRVEFACGASIEICFLINKSGNIIPTLGNSHSLSAVTGLGSQTLFPYR
jgi:hypothetical protein